MIETVSDVTLVGTVHVSPKSVAEVEATIRRLRPRKVFVELDADRLKALEDPEAWKRTDIIRIIKEKRQHQFLAHVVLASFQYQIAQKTGVSPGTELLRAVQVGREVGSEVVLMDRNISITLRRTLAELGFWGKIRTLWGFWMQIVTPAEDQTGMPDNIEDLLKTDALTALTDEMGRRAPIVKRVLLDERDQYMASYLRPVLGASVRSSGWESASPPVAPDPSAVSAATPTSDGLSAPAASIETASPANTILEAALPSTTNVEPGTPGGYVAVVGAGHVSGMKRILEGSERLPERENLEVIRKPTVPVGKIIGWAIPLALVGFFVYLAVMGRFEDLRTELSWFVLVTGGLSALGAALAWGHPLSILTAFVAAPIGVLHPLLATGWFSGIVEAKVRSPTVRDFENLKTMQTAGDFWRNRVMRVILVTAFTNLGAMASTWWIGKRIFDALGGA